MADKDSELYEIERLGFTPTKNSGRGHHQKADGIYYSPFGDPLFSVDVKESNKSFTLSESVWAKIATDAKKNRTEPILKPVLGVAEPKDRLVVITESLFLDMLEAWKEKYYGE